MKRGRVQLICRVLLMAACCILGPTSSNVALAGTSDRGLDALVAGNTDFALNLYARLRTTDGNLFFSPYSVSTALAMTYGGARGETARQMAKVLHFPLDSKLLHAAFEELMSSDAAAADESGYRLHLANALWGQQGENFLTEFLDLTSKHYGAGLREVDFRGNTEQVRRTINAWVDAQTQHEIKELLQKGNLEPTDVLVLTNAIYFKGDWASQFDKQLTKLAPFWLNGTDQVSVPMMYQLGRFKYATFDKFNLLELPYQGDRLSMVLISPKEKDGLSNLEESLNRDSIERWLRQQQEQPVRVTLPRFGLTSRVDLARTLETMGMTDAFSSAKADFSGMTGLRGLFIGMVIHEARVEVTEEGTEAGAATAVQIKKGPATAAFTADHPFLFLIRDNLSGSILFLGRVVNPKL